MQNIRDFIKKVYGPTVAKQRVGSAHILFLVLVFILASGFWFVWNQGVPGFKFSEFKKEIQPSAAGVIFSEKQEPAVEQAERYYKDHNIHIRRGR